jgi:hypothetical protein
MNAVEVSVDVVNSGVWSWVRIFDFWGVSGGVVLVMRSNLCLFGGHQFLSFGDQWLCSAWSWVRIFDILGGQWWCSAWSCVPIFDFLGSMVVQCMVVGSNL